MNANVSSDSAKNEFGALIMGKPLKVTSCTEFTALIMGKPLEVAQALAKEYKYHVRCVKLDGKNLLVHKDHRPHRCNVIVNDGLISGCTGFH